jgi:hypothetical protein
MTSDKFIGSITNKVYNQIRQSISDAEARRYLKEHQAKQLTLTDVVGQSEQLECDACKYIAIYEGYEISYLECLKCGKGKAY